MPWNHISARNIGFNGNMNAGGTVNLDAGKPISGMFDRTIKNLREVSPRVFGSASVAFAMLAWPNIAAARKVAGLPDDAALQDAISHPKVVEHLRNALGKHNKAGSGSPTGIARIHLMLEPPSIDGHEIADKGYVNQAATAARRAHLAERPISNPRLKM